MVDVARARKLAERIKVLVAESLEKTVKDPDLGFVTLTEVKVTQIYSTRRSFTPSMAPMKTAPDQTRSSKETPVVSVGTLGITSLFA